MEAMALSAPTLLRGAPCQSLSTVNSECDGGGRSKEHSGRVRMECVVMVIVCVCACACACATVLLLQTLPPVLPRWQSMFLKAPECLNLALNNILDTPQ